MRLAIRTTPFIYPSLQVRKRQLDEVLPELHDEKARRAELEVHLESSTTKANNLRTSLDKTQVSCGLNFAYNDAVLIIAGGPFEGAAKGGRAVQGEGEPRERHGRPGGVADH